MEPRDVAFEEEKEQNLRQWRTRKTAGSLQWIYERIFCKATFPETLAVAKSLLGEPDEDLENIVFYYAKGGEASLSVELERDDKRSVTGSRFMPS
ncbi:MAG: hypothetical protein L6R28_10760 [Planctomycetes bacterium]|nr:hypothetical protein [Planctomycetota bacterium]